MVRSPHPHAGILSVDASAALTMPGVLAVFTGADCAADGLGGLDHSPLPKTRFDLKLHGPGGSGVFVGDHSLLPRDKARYVGEAVAMAVAGTGAEARDAAEAVFVDYEPLPAVTDTAEAAGPGAPLVWDDRPDNILVETFFGDEAGTEAAFATAAHVVGRRFVVPRVTGCPLEPRAALAEYDPETGRYTIYAGSGGAVRQKREIAAVLGVEPDRVRIHAYDVGGNFGTRNRCYVEFPLVAWAARKLGRPVKCTVERSEALISDYQGRDLVTEVTLAFDRDGTILGLRAGNLSNVGARCVSLSPLSKGRGSLPARIASRSRGCDRARPSPTPRRPTPIAARAGRNASSR